MRHKVKVGDLVEILYNCELKGQVLEVVYVGSDGAIKIKRLDGDQYPNGFSETTSYRIIYESD